MLSLINLIKNKKVYLISDTHFTHKNVLKFEPIRQQYLDRNIDENNITIDDIDAMNKMLINRWNSEVGKDDTVLHLGDILMNKSYKRDITANLNGRKYYITGNHDYESMRKRIVFDGWTNINWYIENYYLDYNMVKYMEKVNKDDERIVELVSFIICRIDNYNVMFSHFPIYCDDNRIIERNIKYKYVKEHLNNIALLANIDINFHGHVHSNNIILDERFPIIKHFNMSVEKIDMKPKKISQIL